MTEYVFVAPHEFEPRAGGKPGCRACHSPQDQHPFNLTERGVPRPGWHYARNWEPATSLMPPLAELLFLISGVLLVVAGYVTYYYATSSGIVMVLCGVCELAVALVLQSRRHSRNRR